MKILRFFTVTAVLCCAVPLLSSCRSLGRTEPEQMYLVSALGFDGAGDLLTVTAEIPLTRENEAEEMETKRFSGTGTSVEAAMEDLTSGLPKRLLFSHCALTVLGDGLNAEQIRSVLAFCSDGKTVPLSAQVVSAPAAGELLGAGSISTPAAGYDIPGILRQKSKLLGMDLRCRLYEIGADGERGMMLPRVEPTGSGENGAVAAWHGTRVILPDGAAFSLSEEQSVCLSAVQGRFLGGEESPGSFLGIGVRRVKRALRAQREEGGVLLTLSLWMESRGASDGSLSQAVAARIAGVTEELLSSRPELYPFLRPACEKLLPKEERAVLGKAGNAFPRWKVTCEISDSGKEARP